jgi:tetratricopeptide (TPR) repeat protein
MITQRAADGHRRSNLAIISGYSIVLRRLFFLSLIGIVVLLGVWALLSSPMFLRWRYRHMTLLQMIRQFPKHRVDPIFLYYLGLKLNQRGDYVHADPVLRHAVGLDPDNPKYRDEWARALLGSGLVTAAFGELRQYVGTHPQSAQAHYLMGKFYVSQRAMDKASDELQKA